MPRQARHAPGGLIYHVLNRAAGRRELFGRDGDYGAFLRVLGQSLENNPMRLCAFCLMPNHWHMVLWPEKDGEASIRHCLKHNRPFGSELWTARMERTFELSPVRPRGRPKKPKTPQ
jgi:REP element-mobilizing transposase RayT